MLKHYHTIRHLKPIQIRYRLYYAMRARLRRLTGYKYNLSLPARGFPVDLENSIPAQTSWLGDRRFRFLNLEHDFGDKIDWNFAGHGKLWAYNLNYFEYLGQEGMTREEGLGLMHEFVAGADNNREGMEPYPTSLRVMNWIKFICKHKLQDQEVDASLYAQLMVLVDNLEYHLLGNHLLENGFALVFGGLYFQDDELRQKALDILKPELEEQILHDGAHFELSPMYHQLMLFRVLDCINLLAHSRGFCDNLTALLRSKAALMLGWLKQMAFSNREIPLFNDSAPDIAPSTQGLEGYARRLGIKSRVRPLAESGYRRFDGCGYELIVDAGPIGPDYIPGHGHCDMLSFVLHVHGKPWMVDTGTSTYEQGRTRQFERSTAAHNTVSMEGREQSEAWAAFRVARRAGVRVLEENKSGITAEHDGFGVWHRRTFNSGDQEIHVTDELNPNGRGTARFHLAPGLEASVSEDIVRCESMRIYFAGHDSIWIEPYLCATGFNKRAQAMCICVGFTYKLNTRMEFCK